MFFTSKHEKLLNLEGTVRGGVLRMVEKINVSVYVYSTFHQPLANAATYRTQLAM